MRVRTYSRFEERKKEKRTEKMIKEKECTWSVFGKNGLVVSEFKRSQKKKKKKENALALARANQKKSDATRLIYDAVTHALYNSLIALSAYR